MGYEQDVSTRMLQFFCALCGRPLRDPESVERGWGPVCDRKHCGGMGTAAVQLGAEAAFDADKTRQAMLAAPDTRPENWTNAEGEKITPVSLRDRWAELGGNPDDANAKWRTDYETRRHMFSVGMWYASRAITFGFEQDVVSALKVDPRHLMLASVETFARAIGMHKAADRMAKAYSFEILKETIVFERVDPSHKTWARGQPVGEGVLRLHAPYSEAFNRLARENKTVFFAFEKDQGRFYRYFRENNLDQVVNILQGCYGDRLCLNPDGDLMTLPSMPLPPPMVDTPATGGPNIATDELPEVPEEAEQLRIGDEVELPDGRKLKIQWIDPKKKRVGVGKRKGRNYVFFSFEEIEVLNGKEIATSLTKKRERENREEGIDRHAEKVELPPEVPAGLMPHQVANVAFIVREGRGLIADEMGLGKTISAIAVFQKPAVVVCPSLLKVNWVREINKWNPTFDVAMVEGKKEPDALVQNADVVVINYDILAAHVEWLMARNNAAIIADEAHYLKNLDLRWNKASQQHESTKRSPQRAAAFYKMQREVRRLIFLTGTPILNRTKELFPLLHMLNPREWNSGYQFCIRYCAGHNEWVRQRGGGQRQVFNCNGRSNTDELHQRISNKYMMRHTKAQVLRDLPPKSRRSMSVSLSREYKKRYTKAVRDFLKWIKEQGGPEAVARVMRAEALVKLTKLRAISAAGKAEAAVEYIKEFVESTGRPLGVMGVHKEAFRLIEEGLAKANDAYAKAKDKGELPPISKPIRYGKVVGGQAPRERQRVIDAFQRDGTLDVILYSIPIATGTTLTRAQDVMFLERLWRPADQVQAEDRFHRIGQTNAVTVTYLDAEGTIDQKMGMLLMDKATTAAQVIDGVDLSGEQASMLVFGEMFDLGSGFLDSLEDVLEDASAVAGEAFDQDQSGLAENPWDGSSLDDGNDIEPWSNPEGMVVADSWDDPL